MIVDRLENAADTLVERVNHRRMNPPPVAPLFVGGQRPAGGRFLPAAGRLDRLQVGIQRQVLLLGLDRRVRRTEGHVEEERRLAAGVPVDEAHRVFGQQVRHVALLVDGLVVVTPVAFALALLREVVDRRVVADELREAAAQRVELALEVAEVPLAEDAAVFVAGPGKDLGQRGLRGVHAVVAPGRDDRPHQAETDRIAARHQAGTGRRTDRRAVEPFEAHALGGDAVDVRRGDLAAVEADVVAAEIVRDDQDDVGEGVRDGRIGGAVGTAGEEQKRGGEEPAHPAYASRRRSVIFCREAPKAGSRPPRTPVTVARKIPEKSANGVVRN